MLAHCFDTRTENPYEASRTALVLYAQNAKPMLKNAAWVTLWVWLLSLLIFLIMLAPAGLVVWLLPGEMSAAGLVFALLFAWAVKVALIEPFAIACMLQAYFKLTAGQAPDPAWQARLEQASSKFKSLGERALVWASPKTASKGA
jgi:Na+/phosphate symporter